MTRATRRNRPQPFSYQPPRIPHCWFCQRPNATGQVLLGGAQTGRTPIPRCPAGFGCQDGRVRHGPGGAPPHWPMDPCEACQARAAKRR